MFRTSDFASFSCAKYLFDSARFLKFTKFSGRQQLITLRPVLSVQFVWQTCGLPRQLV